MAAFATDVPSNIYAFHRYTGNSTTLSCTLACQFEVPFPGWARGFHTSLNKPPTRPLRPVIPINARTLRITAAAGTELAGAYSASNVTEVSYSLTPFPPCLKCFTTLEPSSHTRHGWVRLAPIAQYSPLLPPVGVWAVSQSQCG